MRKFILALAGVLLLSQGCALRTTSGGKDLIQQWWEWKIPLGWSRHDYPATQPQ